MPGPAGQELRDRRRRTATLLSKYIKESAQAWDGATSANRLERSATQTAHAAPEAPSVPGHASDHKRAAGGHGRASAKASEAEPLRRDELAVHRLRRRQLPAAPV